jgi:hypothetical protein
MPAWATVVITLGAAAIGVLGTLAATRVQTEHATAERETTEATRRREGGAGAVAPILSLLDDAAIDVLLAGVKAAEQAKDRNDRENRFRELAEEQARLWDRWYTLRDPLLIYAGSHPSPEISEMAQGVLLEIGRVLRRRSWLMFTRAAGTPILHEFSLSEAKRRHGSAVEQAAKLLERVRLEPGK